MISFISNENDFKIISKNFKMITQKKNQSLDERFRGIWKLKESVNELNAFDRRGQFSKSEPL